MFHHILHMRINSSNMSGNEWTDFHNDFSTVQAMDDV